MPSASLRARRLPVSRYEDSPDRSRSAAGTSACLALAQVRRPHHHLSHAISGLIAQAQSCTHHPRSRSSQSPLRPHTAQLAERAPPPTRTLQSTQSHCGGSSKGPHMAVQAAAVYGHRPHHFRVRWSAGIGLTVCSAWRRRATSTRLARAGVHQRRASAWWAA